MTILYGQLAFHSFSLDFRLDVAERMYFVLTMLSKVRLCIVVKYCITLRQGPLVSLLPEYT